MKDTLDLIIRLTLAVLAAVFIKVYYIIFSPLTIYSTLILLKIFNFSPTLTNNIISVGHYNLTFVPACVAASAYLLLTLLILLTKDIKPLTRIYMFLIGSFLILAVNLIRIMILAYILINYNKDLFNAVHYFFWFGIATVLVVIIWLILIKIFKITSIPVYTDVRYLLKKTKNTDAD